jgi:cytosine/adenosine deaminase-related metal-dependent hydrolase
MRRIAAHYLINCGLITPRPLISVDDAGRIIGVEQWQQLDNLSITEFYSGALSPGFVNAHCHIELSYLRGAIAPGTGFAGFARAIGQVRGGFSMEERERALRAADATMWAEGVQAVGDVVNGDSSYAMKRQSPIRYHSFAELFGLLSSVEAIAPLLEHPATSPTPHSTYSLQQEAFASVASKAGENPLSIHFMESPDERALYSHAGSLWSWYERMGWQCDFLHYGSPAGRLCSSLDASQRLMLVHNCCIEEEDVAAIESHFHHPVAWVLCPRSNDYISGLRPAFELLRRHRALICLGTDSLASNTSLSILEEIKSLREVPLAERFEWATLGGARALGMDDELGSIEVGKRPGIVLIEGLSQDELLPSATARRII